MVRHVVWVLLAAAACSGGRTETKGEVVESSVTVLVEGSGGHRVIVTNHGKEPVRLRRDIAVTRDEAGAWVVVDTSGLYLREHCDAPGGGLYEPPACVELAAGATLRAEPWTDNTGDAQCACEECGPVPAGKYRMTVTSCDDGTAYASDTFDVAGR
jgi:hypothetical protein